MISDLPEKPLKSGLSFSHYDDVQSVSYENLEVVEGKMAFHDSFKLLACNISLKNRFCWTMRIKQLAKNIETLFKVKHSIYRT